MGQVIETKGPTNEEKFLAKFMAEEESGKFENRKVIDTISRQANQAIKYR